MIHAGRIDTNSTTARVFDYLRANIGRWVDARTMARAIDTTAIGTRISEVRRRVAAESPVRFIVDPAYRTTATNRAGRRVFLVLYRMRRIRRTGVR